jgi:hypothetical protein
MPSFPIGTRVLSLDGSFTGTVVQNHSGLPLAVLGLPSLPVEDLIAISWDVNFGDPSNQQKFPVLWPNQGVTAL